LVLRLHRQYRSVRFSTKLLAIASLALLPFSGCARAPANGSGGLRLIVTLQFAGTINSNYQYFFLIRNGADQVGQNGPIPVIQPPYLNGFATGSNTATAAFTDFVEYSRVQRQATSSGYAVYHVPGGISGNPNLNVFNVRGEPDASTPPTTNTIRFELNIDRLQPDSTDVDPNNGQTPRYLQVNAIATTTTPTNPQSIDTNKIVDAFGDQTLGSGSFNNFITIDLSQIGRIYQSTNNAGDIFFEPEHDSFPDDRDPGIDLVAWSIQVLGG
jgi:hypothetical protein